MKTVLRGIMSTALLLASGVSLSAGPDVVVNEVTGAREFFTGGSGSMVSLASGTDSCNLGTSPLSWNRPPASSHPVISLNLYRVHNGRFEQLARSWVKHGFFATNATDCSRIPGAPATCSAPNEHEGQSLYPGCTDLYPDALNSDPSWLGARSKINPTTGMFDGASARDTGDLPTSSPEQWALHLQRSDLLVSGAQYFVEAHYIAADDAAARNSRNNTTHAEVIPRVFGGLMTLQLASIPGQVWKEPALMSWKGQGATVEDLKFEEVSGYDSHAMVGVQVTPLPSGAYRYDYAVYNMNSDRGFQAFIVESGGVDPGTLGFSAPMSYGEHWSNDPWKAVVDGASVTWSTDPYATSPNANALRWGTTYSFWFDSRKAPVSGTVKLVPFKPPATGAAPLDLTLNVPVPGL